MKLADARARSCNGVAILLRAGDGLPDVVCAVDGTVYAWSRCVETVRGTAPGSPAKTSRVSRYLQRCFSDHARAFSARKDWQPIDPRPGAMAA